MKIKARIKKGNVEVKAIIKHANTTYDQAQQKTGDRENANFITHITASVKDQIVFEGSTSQFLAKNTIFKFAFNGIGEKGDYVTITWRDRKGNTTTDKKKIK